MPKFVIYEVWTKARIIEAENYPDAYVMGEPDSQFAAETGLSPATGTR